MEGTEKRREFGPIDQKREYDRFMRGEPRRVQYLWLCNGSEEK
jgi:hypothetical protein